jgi:exopolysaccharide biosynthesis protein
MKNYAVTRVVVLNLLIVLSPLLNAQIKGFNKIKWEKEKPSPGLTWKSSHTYIDDTVPQNINILFINTRKRDVSLVYSREKNIKTSIQASDAGAIAAINAGFFNVKDGGSVTYIKTGGKVADIDTALKWRRLNNMNGSVIVDTAGNVHITKAMENSFYDSQKNFRDVLITGPVLLKDKKKVALPQTSLVINSHPRSCIGIINRNKIILLTLDGRSDQAAGMTLMKLADLMLSLKCRDGVNLDGGGSTTMWIRGKPWNGVVNMPCDNKRFDHEGERAVSNILIVR